MSENTILHTRQPGEVAATSRVKVSRYMRTHYVIYQGAQYLIGALHASGRYYLHGPNNKTVIAFVEVRP